MTYYIKKAAMFGLDARIALAIFGALSVISSAALYSAIQESKTTALLTDINEIGKAWEQYMLDTGSDLPVKTAATMRERIVNELLSSTSNQWKGPYLSNYKQSSYDANHIEFNNNSSRRIGMAASANVNWGYGHGTYPQWWNTGIICNDTTILCYNIINIYDSTSSNAIFNEAEFLDKKVDNGDGAYQGKVRWWNYNSQSILSYIYAPYKMPQ